MPRLLFQQGFHFFAVSYLVKLSGIEKSGNSGQHLVFSPLIDADQAKEANKYKLT
jgi:hypothetical protein